MPKDVIQPGGVQQKPPRQVSLQGTWSVTRGWGTGAYTAWGAGGFGGTSQQRPCASGLYCTYRASSSLRAMRENENQGSLREGIEFLFLEENPQPLLLPLWAGGWARGPPEVSPSLSFSMIFWYKYEAQQHRDDFLLFGDSRHITETTAMEPNNKWLFCLRISIHCWNL